MSAWTPDEPTGDQCQKNAVVFEDEHNIGYADFYPQMGGYCGFCVVVINKKDMGGGCFDVWVWHDGEFPFSETDGSPARLHHCMAEQFIKFGKTVRDFNQKEKGAYIKDGDIVTHKYGSIFTVTIDGTHPKQRDGFVSAYSHTGNRDLTYVECKDLKFGNQKVLGYKKE